MSEFCPICGRAQNLRPRDLSPAELRTVLLVMGGMSKYSRVAVTMGTTEQVVKNRMCKVFKKLGIRSKLALAPFMTSLQLQQQYDSPIERETAQLAGVC